MSTIRLGWSFGGFLLAWVALNLIQAGFTQLDADEAYYWMYAQHLDWGYFDHPPAAAFLIKLGTWLLPGTLGLRFFIVLANAATFWIIWDLADRPRQGLALLSLILLSLAMPFLHLYAFIATADAPLMLCTALFFWGYRRFWQQPNLMNALLWALIMAALLYSKYHGILLIFFTLLSNWRLFRQPWFYLAGIAGALLYLPHLFWQYSHDFPSFRYHLKGRDDVYELKYTLNYLLNQVLIFSPLLWPYLLRAWWKIPDLDFMQRSFRWVALGFWTFFLWSTSKGHVEPQWTAILSIPVVLVLYAYTRQAAFSTRSLRRLAFVSLLLILLVRISLLFQWGPMARTFDQLSWIRALEPHTQGLPVLFHNSYRNPALYQFYTGQPAYEMTTAEYRKSQYDLWDDEQALQGQTIYLVLDRKTRCSSCDTLQLGKKTMLGRVLNNFQVIEKCTIAVVQAPQRAKAGERIQVRLRLSNPYPFDLQPPQGEFPLRLAVAFHRDGQYLTQSFGQTTAPLGTWQAGQTYSYTAEFEVPAGLKGAVELIFGLSYGAIQPTMASPTWRLALE